MRSVGIAFSLLVSVVVACAPVSAADDEAKHPLSGSWRLHEELSKHLSGEQYLCRFGRAWSFATDGREPVKSKGMGLVTGTATVDGRAHGCRFSSLGEKLAGRWQLTLSGDVAASQEGRFQLLRGAMRSRDLLFLRHKTSSSEIVSAYVRGSAGPEPRTAEAEVPSTPPAAGPVVCWLQAAKNNDVELLKTVFSERIAHRHARRGWLRVMDVYREVFANEFGKYTLKAFTYAFEGDDQRGKVTILYGERRFPVEVVRERGVWKVNER